METTREQLLEHLMGLPLPSLERMAKRSGRPIDEWVGELATVLHAGWRPGDSLGYARNIWRDHLTRPAVRDDVDGFTGSLEGAPN